MRQYSLVIIGFGGMGEQHYRLLEKHPLLKVTGVCDINLERQSEAKALGLKVYETYESVLMDSSVNMVLIATPNHIHKEIAIAALNGKKHVICEKPVTLNSHELEEILAVQEKTGYVFMVHQNRRWDEDFLTIKKIYDTKQLGELYQVEQRVFGSRGIPGDWRKNKEFGGGMLLDWGVHMLDRLLIMIPEKIVSVDCYLSFALKEEVDDGYHLRLIFESGKSAICEVGTTNLISLPKWYVTFTKGTAIVEDWFLNGKIVSLKNVDNNDARPIVAGAGLTKTMAPRHDDSTLTIPLDKVYKDHKEFYTNFIDVVEKKAEPFVKNCEVLRVMKLIDTAFKSNEIGQRIKFED